MLCPKCNNLNAATTVRCIECGATLIYEADGHSVEFNAAAKKVDLRIYSAIGSFAGLGISILLQSTVLQHQYFDQRAVAVIGIGIGAALGRAAAAYKWRYS
jgi:hypothetical protein